MRSTTISSACTSVLGAVLAFASMNTTASMLGVPGEAQLVPLAIFGEDAGRNEDYNTYVYVTAPSSFQRDTIFTDFTAVNVAPDTGGYTFPGSTQTVFWYFYGQDGSFVSGASGSFALGPDDGYLFDWRREAAAKLLEGTLENLPGYLVFATQAARNGNTANFAIEAKAWLSTDVVEDFRAVDPTDAQPLDINEAGSTASIPALAMSDGADTAGVGPRIGNEVVYSGAVPDQVAPLITGLRLSNGDGDQNDTVNFGLPLLVANTQYSGFNRKASTLLVVWLDADGPASRSVSVVDSAGNTCQAVIDLSDRLNTLYVFEFMGSIKVSRQPFAFRTPPDIADLPDLCYPANVSEDLDEDSIPEPFENIPGYVSITLPEGTDEGPGTGATSAGVAFSILFPGSPDEEGAVPSDSFSPVTLLAKDRGK